MSSFHEDALGANIDPRAAFDFRQEVSKQDYLIIHNREHEVIFERRLDNPFRVSGVIIGYALRWFWADFFKRFDIPPLHLLEKYFRFDRKEGVKWHFINIHGDLRKP